MEQSFPACDMEVKSEPTDPKPCQFEGLYQGNMTLKTSCFENEVQTTTTKNSMSVSEEKMVCSTKTFMKYNSKESDVSHALPRRIALMHQRLHSSSNHERTLAQPKGTARNRSISRKWKNGGLLVNNVNGTHHTKQSNYQCKRDKNSVANSDESDDCSEATSTVGPSPMTGLFGWTLIDNIYIPYVFREDNQQYACVKLLEHKLLNKFPNVFPSELSQREPLTSSVIKQNEYELFNHLLLMQAKGKPDTPDIGPDDVVVLLSEFVSFYNVVKKLFPECSEKDKSTNENKCVKSGWFQVNNTIIPYVCRATTKFLPMAVLKHAASISVNVSGVPASELECKELNKRCAEEGFRFTFKTSAHLIPLDDLKKICNLHLLELPKKNPLKHTHYIINRDSSPDRLHNDSSEATDNYVRHFRNSQQTPISEHAANYGKDKCVDRVTVFMYNKDPSKIHCGSPNVAVVPQNHSGQMQLQSHSQNKTTPTKTEKLIANQISSRPLPSLKSQMCSIGQLSGLQDNIVGSGEDITSFNLDRPHNTYYHNYGHPVIPGTILNAIPSGQNINVNYGINIQNITASNEVSEHTLVPKHPIYPAYTGSTEDSRYATVNEHFYSANLSSFPTSTQPNGLQSAQQSGRITEKTPRNGKSRDGTVMPNPTSYHLRQKQAVTEIISCIRSVWLAGKNISCLHLNKPGRTGRFCLVEAICKLYFRTRTVSEFLFTIEKVLMTVTCTELEEQAFIQYYQLPVSVLKCNKMVELAGFERMFPQLSEILNGRCPQTFTPSSVRFNILDESLLSQRERLISEESEADKSPERQGKEQRVVVIDNLSKY